MSDAQHTPGTWTAVSAEGEDWVVAVRDGEGTPVAALAMPCTAYSGDAKGVTVPNLSVLRAEMRANARLIAAAPVMLAALREIVALLDREHGVGAVGGMEPGEALRVAREALARVPS
jgi:hypothetical protein